MADNIEIESKSGKFQVYLSLPEKKEKLPGIILIHEVWGLNAHIKNVADRLAAQGYAVLAPDLLSHTGITQKINQGIMKEIMDPATKDEAQKKMREAMTPIKSPEFAESTVEKLQACFEYLKLKNYSREKVGVMGFCFGGTYSYALAAAEPGLSAAVVFYGHMPQPIGKISTIQCPVLVFNGEKDQGIMGHLPELKEAVAKYSKNFEFHEYAQTGHAFFNDTNQALYNKEAAQDAWQKTLAFLSANLL